MIASGINIGRKRGEFERATKIMRSVQQGAREPGRAGLCHISRLADLASRAGAKFCSQDKNGRHARGEPDTRWIQANPPAPGYAAGFTGRALDPEKLHVFFCETQDTTLRGGHVFVKRGERVLAWCEPELFGALGAGYRLTIRFDPSEPTLGAAVFNRELGSRNHFDFSLGQFLGIADYAPEAPQVVTGQGFLTDEELAAKGMRKRYTSAVRSEYRSIGVFGTRKTRASIARDGRGGVAVVETSKDLTRGGVCVPGSCGPETELPSHSRYPAGDRRARFAEVDEDQLTAEADELERKLMERGDLITMPGGL